MQKIGKLMILTVMIVSGTLSSPCSGMRQRIILKNAPLQVQERILKNISLNTYDPSHEVSLYMYNKGMTAIIKSNVPFLALSVTLRQVQMKNAPTLIQYYPSYRPDSGNKEYNPDRIDISKPINIMVNSKEDLKIWRDWLDRRNYEQRVLPPKN